MDIISQEKEVYETDEIDWQDVNEINRENSQYSPTTDNEESEFIASQGNGWKHRHIFERSHIPQEEFTDVVSGKEKEDFTRSKLDTQEEKLAARAKRLIEEWKDLEHALLVSRDASSSVLENDMNDVNMLSEQLRYLQSTIPLYSRGDWNNVLNQLKKSLSLSSLPSPANNEIMRKDELSLNVAYGATNFQTSSISLNSSNLTELEVRLARIETQLGIYNSSSLATLSMMEQLNLIERQLAYIDPRRIEFIMSRLKDLDQHLEQLKHHSTSNVPLECIQKIEMLYDRIPLIDYALNGLPPIIDRLNSIKHLFGEVSSFSATLQSVILDQESMKQALHTQQHQLSKVLILKLFVGYSYFYTIMCFFLSLA
jgi:hypothetical protein